MKKPNAICRTLFFSMLKISAFTFGGGFVIIPLMRRRFVERLKWVSEEDMMDMMAIAQSSPGAVSLNIAAQLGFRMKGWAGTAAGVAGTILPPAVWLAVISYFYDFFRSSPVVDAFLRSMQPAVSAVILCAAVSMLRSLKHKKRISTWLLIAAAIALSVLGVSALWILFMGAVIGILTAFWEVKRHVR